MKWRNQKYELWVVNTTAEVKLYLWEKWKYLYSLADALVALSPSNAFIRTHQSLEHKNAWLGFGRMAWNKINNEKWTKKYRENEFVNADVTFSDTEIWAPDWNQFVADGMPPDIFIQIYNTPRYNISNYKDIREGVIIAIPKKIVKKNIRIIDSVLNDMLKIIPHSMLARTTRTWWAGWGHVNDIQDISFWALEKMLKKEGR